MREDLIERLRTLIDARCGGGPSGPNYDPELLEVLNEAADALEAAQTGLRYVVRVYVLSDEIKWSEEKIDEVVESIISDAKKEAGNG